MGVHADLVAFPVHTHVHRKALIFLASAPMGIHGSQVGVHTDPGRLPVHAHMHRKALVFLASAPMGIYGRPVGVHADPGRSLVHAHTLSCVTIDAPVATNSDLPLSQIGPPPRGFTPPAPQSQAAEKI